MRRVLISQIKHADRGWGLTEPSGDAEVIQTPENK